MCVQASSGLTVRQSVFANNTGMAESMAVKTTGATLLHIESTTIINNRAMPPTGIPLNNRAMSLSCYGSSTCTFKNSISWDGDASDSNTPHLYSDKTASLTASFSDILGGNWAGTNGNIEADPLLDPCFTPTAGSPVINAGDPAYAGPDATDFLGNPRLQGGRVDMGAVEVQPNNGAGCPTTGGGGGQPNNGSAGGGSGGGSGMTNNRAPALIAGFTPAISLGANQVSSAEPNVCCRSQTYAALYAV